LVARAVWAFDIDRNAAMRIEQRLDHAAGSLLQAKGMLWRTFHPPCDRYDHHNAVLNAGLVRAVERLMGR